MAVDPWAIDAAAGAPAYSAQDARLTTVVPFLGGAGASLGVRSGVRLSGSGTDLLVQAQSSPNMTVKVNPGCAVVQGATSTLQGAYSWALDTTTNLTIAAAHASLSRTDLVCVRIRDASVDTSGQRDASVVVITGTAGGGVPSLPTDATYMTIAQITVGAGVGSITSGAIADRRQYLFAAGATIFCTSTTRPSASSCPPGQAMVELDTGFTYRNNTAATKWLRDEVVLYKTTSQSVNSATPVTDSHLFLTGEANATYVFDIAYGYTALTTPKINLGLVFPSGCRLDFSRTTRDVNGAVYSDFVPNVVSSPFLNTSSPASNSYGNIRLSGTIAFAGTAGTFQLTIAQFVIDNANPSYGLQGSWMRYRQVA